MSVNLTNPNENEAKPKQHVVQLEDILSFFTGSPAVPAEGFANAPQLSFNHDMSVRHATSSTCDLKLTIPVHFHDFKDMMVTSVYGYIRFGNP